jgi:bisphosphoglycerate-independent phosphoglycerate mutase (AlkP superfamily)
MHAYLDGRDVAPKSALEFITQLQKTMQELQVGEFGHHIRPVLRNGPG